MSSYSLTAYLELVQAVENIARTISILISVFMMFPPIFILI